MTDVNNRRRRWWQMVKMAVRVRNNHPPLSLLHYDIFGSDEWLYTGFMLPFKWFHSGGIDFGKACGEWKLQYHRALIWYLSNQHIKMDENFLQFILQYAKHKWHFDSNSNTLWCNPMGRDPLPFYLQSALYPTCKLLLNQEENRIR